MLRAGSRACALVRVPCRSIFNLPPGPPSVRNTLEEVQRRFQELERDIFGGGSHRWSPFSGSSPFSGPGQQVQHRQQHGDSHDLSANWRPFGWHPTDTEQFRVRNPVIEENGVKKFKMEFDVRRFKPEDVKISTDKQTDTLKIEAAHRDENSSFSYSRRVTVPAGVALADITAKYTSDGVLVFEAPFTEPHKPELPKEQIINIEHK